MRKFAIALGVTAALVSAGGLALQADATTLRAGRVKLPTAGMKHAQVCDCPRCHGSSGVGGRPCLAGRRYDLESGNVEPSQRSKELFARRGDRPLWGGQALPAWI